MIAYYAHQENEAALHFSKLFQRTLSGRLKILSEAPMNHLDSYSYTQLTAVDEFDLDTNIQQSNSPHYLYNNRFNCRGQQLRSYELLQEFALYGTKFLIVDGDVELAILSRTSCIPYAYVKEPHTVLDYQTQQAMMGAVAVLAYYPEALEDLSLPQWLQEKMIHLDFLPIVIGKGNFYTSNDFTEKKALAYLGSNDNFNYLLNNCNCKLENLPYDDLEKISFDNYLAIVADPEILYVTIALQSQLPVVINTQKFEENKEPLPRWIAKLIDGGYVLTLQDAISLWEVDKQLSTMTYQLKSGIINGFYQLLEENMMELEKIPWLFNRRFKSEPNQFPISRRRKKSKRNFDTV